jgi:hypothetical protein
MSIRKVGKDVELCFTIKDPKEKGVNIGAFLGFFFFPLFLTILVVGIGLVIKSL